MLLQCCTQYVSKFRKLSSGHRTGKCQFSTQSERRTVKYYKIPLISHTNKVMLKILKVRLQQYMNWELPNVQVGFRKGRGTRDQIVNICWIMEIAREFQKKKTSTSTSLTMLNSLIVWMTTNCGKLLKRWQDQITLRVSEETCMQVTEQELEPNMAQWTGS